MCVLLLCALLRMCLWSLLTSPDLAAVKHRHIPPHPKIRSKIRLDWRSSRPHFGMGWYRRGYLRSLCRLYHTILYYTILYYTVLYCTVLYCTVLYCTVLYCTVLYCTVLYCTVLYCTVLYCTVLYCTVLYCTVPIP